MLPLYPLSVSAAVQDLRIVVDVSAAMTRADPQSMRAEAVGMLTHLLPKDAYAGVWTYAAYVNMLVPHGLADASWKAKALKRTAELPSVGALANLPLAIAEATWDGERAVNRQRQVLLISDGAVRTGSQAPPSGWSARLAADLRASGIRVHVLKLPSAADAPMDPVVLKQLSLATGGQYFEVVDLHALRAAVIRVMDGIAPVAQLPINANQGFLVEPGLHEVTVLRLKQGADPQLSLSSPDGQSITRSSANLSFRWHESAGYDVITITEPQPGRWHFTGATQTSRVLGVGDLTLAAQGLPASVVPGQPKSFQLQLMNGNRPLTDDAFLALVRIEAEVVSEDARRPMLVSRHEEGRFDLRMLAFEAQGDYSVRVLARGPTFQRELILPFSVRHPVAVRVMPHVSGAVAWVEVNSADVDFSSLSVSGRLSRPPQGASPVTGLPFPAGLWKLALSGPPGVIDFALNIKGNYLNGKDFIVKTDPIVLSLPVGEERRYQFDLNGASLVSVPSPAPGKQLPAGAQLPASATQPPSAAIAVPEIAATREAELSLPVWFAVALGLVNLLAGLAAWLVLKPPGPAQQFFTALEELEVLLELPAGEPA